MYTTIINALQNMGIYMEKGLDDNELKKIEYIYGIKFPKEYSSFLKTVLPISRGFYNWRNFDTSNINFIKGVMNKPFEGIINNLDEMDWCDTWGDKPSCRQEYYSVIKKKLSKAPGLIPIFAHRYMPIYDAAFAPVLSIYDLDIIYYGSNLEEYLENEFINKSIRNITFDSITPVPFWSDLI